MNEKITLGLMTEWGYYLLPKTLPHSLGHTGLMVTMRPAPTRLHYDPEALRLRLHKDDQATWTTLTLASPLQEVWPVAPGLVTLHDRVDKRKV